MIKIIPNHEYDLTNFSYVLFTKKGTYNYQQLFHNTEVENRFWIEQVDGTFEGIYIDSNT